jgi:hypothetical protein
MWQRKTAHGGQKVKRRDRAKTDRGQDIQGTFPAHQLGSKPSTHKPLRNISYKNHNTN